MDPRRAGRFAALAHAVHRDLLAPDEIFPLRRS